MAFLASAAYAVQLHYALMAAVALAVILLAQLMRRCKPAWTCLGMLFHSHHDLTLWCSCAVSVHLTSAKPLTAGLFWAAYLFVAAVELDTVVLRLVAQSLCKAPIWLAWQTVRLVHSLAVASAWVHAHWDHIARILLCISSGVGGVGLRESAPQHLLAYGLGCIILVASYERGFLSRMSTSLLLSARRSSKTFNGFHQSTGPACIWLGVVYVILSIHSAHATGPGASGTPHALAAHVSQINSWSDFEALDDLAVLADTLFSACRLKHDKPLCWCSSHG